MEEISRTPLCRVTKEPNTRFVKTDRLIDWISQETNEQEQPLSQRTPQPKVQKYHKNNGFRAADMQYPTLHALTKKALDKNNYLYYDTFGRCVLAVKERFPCFDRYDYMHETRYYRWFYLIHKGRLTCVYYRDESDEIEVTEDVQVIKELAWKTMVDAGVLQDNILQLSNAETSKSL